MDLLLWLAVAVSQVLIGFLGILAIRSDFAQEHFKWFVLSFVLLSLLSMAAAGYSSIRASKFSEMVARLTEQILYEVKGSPDSYLELHLVFDQRDGGDYEKGIANFHISVPSDFPMIDTTIGVSGMRNLGEMPRLDHGIYDYLPNKSYRLPNFTIQLDKEVDIGISFVIQSRSVTLWQDYAIAWNGRAWISDFDLYKEVDGETVYLRRVRDDFPYIGRRKSGVSEEP